MRERYSISLYNIIIKTKYSEGNLKSSCLEVHPPPESESFEII